MPQSIQDFSSRTTPFGATSRNWGSTPSTSTFDDVFARASARPAEREAPQADQPKPEARAESSTRSDKPPTAAGKKQSSKTSASSRRPRHEQAERDTETKPTDAESPRAEEPEAEAADLDEPVEAEQPEVKPETHKDEVDPNAVQLAQQVQPDQKAPAEQEVQASEGSQASHPQAVLKVATSTKPANQAKGKVDEPAPVPLEGSQEDAPLLAEAKNAPVKAKAEESSSAETGFELPKTPASADAAAAATTAPETMSLTNVAMPDVSAGADKAAAHVAAQAAQPNVHIPAENQFAANNVDRIVTNVRTQLLPHGGTMQIRLDPPELGALNVHVKMEDGVVSASFETSNDEATRLLSHNMQQLKSTLEASGVTVDRIQVKQAAPGESSQQKSGDDDQQGRQQQSQDHPARQEQQRREMLQRMWRKLSMGDDPLDLVA